MVFGVSRFKNCIVVVAGAEHPLGAALCRRFAGFGATVIAIGADDAVLWDLAAEAPGAIEPLALRPGRRNVLSVLTEAWGGQPLDIFVDVTALCTATADRGFAQSAGIAAALAEGMREGRAFGVMAVPALLDGASPEQQARTAGFMALVRRFSNEVKPGRLLGMSFPAGSSGWSTSRLTSAGDSVLLMCHPVSRGIADGAVIAWRDETVER